MKTYQQLEAEFVALQDELVKVEQRNSKLASLLKYAQEQEQQRSQELHEKNKEIEQFVYGASHDLQEPLRTIKCFIELFEAKYGDAFDERAKEFMYFISEGAVQMQNLVSGLLDYSRIGAKKQLTNVDMQLVVERTWQSLESLIRQCQAKITVGDLPTIWGYELELNLLTHHLINNAIKFRQPNVSPDIKIAAQRLTDAWQFSVQDNGIGIPPEFQTSVFQVFKQLHEPKVYGGIGIGLAHCKKVVALHYGKIWVDTASPAGSIVYFTIPDKL